MRNGTLIAEKSANGKAGWRIDTGHETGTAPKGSHVNYWNWTNNVGKGHIMFPANQAGPASLHIGYAPWE